MAVKANYSGDDNNHQNGVILMLRFESPQSCRPLSYQIRVLEDALRELHESQQALEAQHQSLEVSPPPSAMLFNHPFNYRGVGWGWRGTN